MAAVVVATAGVLVTVAYGAPGSSWSMSGQGITNWRYQPDENKINAQNARSLTAKWATQQPPGLYDMQDVLGLR